MTIKRYGYRFCFYCNRSIKVKGISAYPILNVGKDSLFFCSAECRFFYLFKIIRVCAYCNKQLNKSHRIRHTNIYNEPKTSFFCSKRCKDLWMFELQEIELVL